MPAHAAAVAAMRALAAEFRPYTWAPPSDEVARLRRDRPLAGRPLRPEHAAAAAALDAARARSRGALAAISGYPAGGYGELRRAIADYNGVEPENVVLGVGADDLILLCARCFARPGDTIAIPERADLSRSTALAAQLAGRRGRRRREPGARRSPAGPNSPDGELRPLPDARPLVVRRGVLRVLRRDRRAAARRRA